MFIVVDDVYVDESQGFARFTIRLTEPLGEAVTFNYATAAETANLNSDYVHSAGTLSFAAGVTELTLDIALVGNTTAERLESFRLAISNVTGPATLATPFARAIIVDNDGATGTPVVRIDD